MNILEDGKWLKLSKVNYQNVWYQIYANSLGIRVFIKDNLEYPSLNSFLYLDMLFNYKNNGIYYSDNKTKQLLSNYFKFTLNINVYYKAYRVCNHFKLIKNKMNGVTKKIEGLNKPKTLITLEEIKDYLPDTFDIEEIIDNNPNIGEEYKEIIKKYVLKHNKDDLQVLAYNLKNIKIIKTNGRSYFDKFNYIIAINPNNLEENLYHELRHASKLVAYNDLYTVLHNDFLISNYKSSIGLAVLEGINAKYTSNNYQNEKNIIDMLILIIGEDEILLSEDEGISSLIDKLSKYSTKEQITKLFMMMDDELICRINGLKYSLNSKMTMFKILIECYLNKLDYMLEDLNIKNIIYKINRYNEEVEKLSKALKTNNELIKQNFEKEYSNCYHEYVKKHIENLSLIDNLQVNSHENIEGYVFVERQIYKENYIINDENFITKRIKYSDNNEVYIYDIYINEDYLKYAKKEELLEYVSLDNLNKALERLNTNG